MGTNTTASLKLGTRRKRAVSSAIRYRNQEPKRTIRHEKKSREFGHPVYVILDVEI